RGADGRAPGPDDLSQGARRVSLRDVRHPRLEGSPGRRPARDDAAPAPGRDGGTALTDTGQAAVPAAPGAASESALARIPGVFFSPVKTFESIARRPTWIAPPVLLTAMSLGLTAALLQKI